MMPRDRLRRDDYDFEDRSRKSRRDSDEGTNPWIIRGPIAAVLVIGLVVAAFFIGRATKSTDTPAEVVDSRPRQNNEEPVGERRKVENPKKTEEPAEIIAIVPRIVEELPADPTLAKKPS